jgi:DNA polymerase-3 subunit gamma/tau
MSDPGAERLDFAREKQAEYVVVARRYRPQSFDELIGQEHVGRALSNAILSNRVGHAYLFTGARGVGKTSAARILAKALNCAEGTSPTPCNRCDICQSIARGDDVDVLEIDGASNRGIDEIRELRQTVSVRPSRARFKIYIIDEVHMLTREAFNALLKTLEEPPEHVKFIFCTTEVEKIPVTILSRCQRFDFAGIQTESIATRLQQIAQAEGVKYDSEALDLLARRAGGSMRDSQSLLEQLLAFCGESIGVADVHRLLGTADDQRLGRIVSKLAERDLPGMLSELDAALAEGIDLGRLVEQLLGFLRDVLVSSVGGDARLHLYAAPAQREIVEQLATAWGRETLLAVMQILDQAASRLRYSTQGRTVVELALIRAATLEQLDELSTLVAEVRAGGTLVLPAGGTDADAAKKKSPAAMASSAAPLAARDETPGSNGRESVPEKNLAAPSPVAQLSAESVLGLWKQAIAIVAPGTSIWTSHAANADGVRWEPPARIIVRFQAAYNLSRSFCERAERVARVEAAIESLVGHGVRVEFETAAEVADSGMSKGPARRGPSDRARLAEAVRHPLVVAAGEILNARPMRVESADGT